MRHRNDFGTGGLAGIGTQPGTVGQLRGAAGGTTLAACRTFNQRAVVQHNAISLPEYLCGNIKAVILIGPDQQIVRLARLQVFFGDNFKIL
ncbi:hypothetical protein D3C86_1858090 [compost metagenome]